MDAFGRSVERDVRVYLVGGSTAVMLGWRESTIDLDIVVVPEDDALLRAIPAIKELLRLNVELAGPADFIPPLPGWEERSPFIARRGKVSFHHYDLYAQALAKIERNHSQDAKDVRSMLANSLVEPDRLRELFLRIEPELFRYPAVDPASFRAAVERALGGAD